jgi:hypothetical protein
MVWLQDPEYDERSPTSISSENPGFFINGSFFSQNVRGGYNPFTLVKGFAPKSLQGLSSCFQTQLVLDNHHNTNLAMSANYAGLGSCFGKTVY